MKKTVERDRRPAPSPARTDRDWAMIALGVLLTLLFVAGGYLSLDRTETAPHPRQRGPVKNPGASSLGNDRVPQNENPLRRAYRLNSSPFPDGVLEQG